MLHTIFCGYKVLFRENRNKIFSENEMVHRWTKYILRQNKIRRKEIIFFVYEVLLRGNQITFRGNKILFRGEEIIWRNILVWGTK